MTANEITRRRCVNPVGGTPPHSETHAVVTDEDATAIINYLDKTGSRSIDQLAGKTKLPRAYLKLLLEALADAGILEHTQDFDEVKLTNGGEYNGA